MQDGFLTMAGPATVGRLKAACGTFSVAQIIRARLPANQGGTSPTSDADGWVLLSERVV